MEGPGVLQKEITFRKRIHCILSKVKEVFEVLSAGFKRPTLTARLKSKRVLTRANTAE
jgi:hypothetical protein